MEITKFLLKQMDSWKINFNYIPLEITLPAKLYDRLNVEVIHDRRYQINTGAPTRDIELQHTSGLIKIKRGPEPKVVVPEHLLKSLLNGVRDSSYLASIEAAERLAKELGWD